MSTDIGEFGYHGTLSINFREGYFNGVYDKSRVRNAAMPGKIHLGISKDIALSFALTTAALVLPNVNPYSNILILWGKKISDSSMSVDVILKPSNQSEGIAFEDITDAF
jgi:hypothetical protein